MFLILILIYWVDAFHQDPAPSFLSDWISMTANTSTAFINIRHMLGELPLLVKVEAKTDEGWIFPGFGSAQTDDDSGDLYGGVVFIYDKISIQIYVPHWNNNKKGRKKWTAHYIGNPYKWIGPDGIKREYVSIHVRARAWKSSNMPPPSWKSGTISVRRGECINTTLEHSLLRYPDLVVAQINTPIGTFQGQGLSSLAVALNISLSLSLWCRLISITQHFGGVLYGVSETHIRLWSACNVNGQYNAAKLFSVADGWGKRGFKQESTGNITVFVWKLTTSPQQITKRLKLADLQNHGYSLSMPKTLTSEEFLLVQVEVLEGPNKNFRFDGVGSVMNERDPYGGLVYGYNDTTLGIWIPHPNKINQRGTAVFLLGEIWGWGYKSQMTDEVDIIITSVIKPGCQCPCSVVGSIPIQANETEKLIQRIAELKTNLTISRKKTSKALRKKISVPDSRPSAQNLGTVIGAGVLICFFGLIVISDFPILWSQFKRNILNVR
ncbi:uncharacterized protein LOC134233297 [Saccostrea cucullata]|uniref:uncharacterized protein LOC134233297 n=1 Tax=Saccostrea cuccullata TaxID=36930 RepID=UPI002ED47637